MRPGIFGQEHPSTVSETKPDPKSGNGNSQESHQGIWLFPTPIAYKGPQRSLPLIVDRRVEF
jgi:hypothetical protein